MSLNGLFGGFSKRKPGLLLGEQGVDLSIVEEFIVKGGIFRYLGLLTFYSFNFSLIFCTFANLRLMNHILILR